MNKNKKINYARFGDVIEKKKVVFFLFFVLPVIFLIVYEDFLIKIPEIFNGAYEIGYYIKNFALASIISYIFYLVVIAIPEDRKQKKVQEGIESKIKNLINFSKIFYISLYHHNSKDKNTFNNIDNTEFKIEEIKEFKTIMNKIESTSIPKYFSEKTSEEDVDPNLNWLYYLSYFGIHSKKIIGELFMFEQYLSGDILNSLFKLDQSGYLSDSNTYFLKSKQKYLSFVSHEIKLYFEELIKLENSLKKFTS